MNGNTKLINSLKANPSSKVRALLLNPVTHLVTFWAVVLPVCAAVGWYFPSLAQF